jgi:hypothetical protein
MIAVTCPRVNGFFADRVYTHSQKFSPNGIALLVKLAVAPNRQSVIVFENFYNHSG